MIMEYISSSDELVERTRMWQDILGLSDWKISVEVAEPSMMYDEDFIGQNNFNMVSKVAVIYILDEKFYGERPMKYCAEKTLVHEMLHCLYDWVKHRGVEELSRSFIMAKL